MIQLPSDISFSPASSLKYFPHLLQLQYALLPAASHVASTATCSVKSCPSAAISTSFICTENCEFSNASDVHMPTPFSVQVASLFIAYVASTVSVIVAAPCAYGTAVPVTLVLSSDHVYVTSYPYGGISTSLVCTSKPSFVNAAEVYLPVPAVVSVASVTTAYDVSTVSASE